MYNTTKKSTIYVTAAIGVFCLTYDPVRPLSDMCYSKDYFRSGRFSGSVLRRLERVGPFTCVRECMLRRSCLSINYNFRNLTCDLNNDRANRNELTLDDDFRYLERPSMYEMIDISPCHGTTCREYERCEILADRSVTCSQPECRPHDNQNIRRLKIFSNSTLAIGEHVRYQCDEHSDLQVTYRCQQDGTWKITDNSELKCECEVKGFTYSDLSKGCYKLVHEKKSQYEARGYCMSTFTGSHLFLADSSQKINAVINALPGLYSSIDLFAWIDGYFIKSTETILTWQGSRPVQDFRQIHEYSNEDFQFDGCFWMISVLGLPTVRTRSICTEQHRFICELN